MLRLFAHRDARLYVAGQTLSLFGDTALFLALAIWAKSLTNSNAAAGLVFFFLALPALFAPLAGMLVDRVRRRPLMIVTDLAVGGVVLLLLFVHGKDQLWLLYLVTVLYGAAASIFLSAQSALLRAMLPDDLLAEGNAALQTVREGLRLVGPLAGAGLFAAFGGGTVAIIDAATFGVSAGCIALLRVEERRTAPAEQHFRTELLAGVRHILHTQALRDIVFGVSAALLVIGFSETLIFAVVGQGLHRPASFIGVVSAGQGVGAVAGALTAASLLHRIGDARLVGLGLGVFALGDLFLISRMLPVVMVGIVVAGAGIPWALVGFGTALQQRTPLNLQGRVYSAADTMAGVPQTFSIALGAGLSTLIDYRILLIVMALVVVACALYLWTRPVSPAPRMADAVPASP